MNQMDLLDACVCRCENAHVVDARKFTRNVAKLTTCWQPTIGFRKLLPEATS